jgi:hypothetical protein
MSQGYKEEPLSATLCLRVCSAAVSTCVHSLDQEKIALSRFPVSCVSVVGTGGLSIPTLLFHIHAWVVYNLSFLCFVLLCFHRNFFSFLFATKQTLSPSTIPTPPVFWKSFSYGIAGSGNKQM